MIKMHLGKKINILSKKIKWGFDIASEKHGVTGMQARVLYFIVKNAENNQVYQKQIEKEFRLRRSTVTGIVQLMEEKKLITRTIAKEDARVKKIELTNKGEKLQKLLYKEINDYESLLIDGIDEEEVENFNKTIEKLYKNIDKFNKEGDL